MDNISQKMTPFDYVNSINSKKAKLGVTKEYVPFIVNRAMSFQKDTIFFANEMNQASDIDNSMQYDFYYHGVPKGSRWGKWSKKIQTDNIKNVQEYFGMPYRKAAETVKILTKSQLKEIEAFLDKGG